MSTSGGPNGDGSHPCDRWGIQEYEIERLRLCAEIKTNDRRYRQAQDRANNDIERLSAEGRDREDAMYRFFRHIQDQVEEVGGWTQLDCYTPEIDGYELSRFADALGDKSDHARWSDLLERFTASTEQQS